MVEGASRERSVADSLADRADRPARIPYSNARSLTSLLAVPRARSLARTRDQGSVSSFRRSLRGGATHFDPSDDRGCRPRWSNSDRAFREPCGSSRRRSPSKRRIRAKYAPLDRTRLEPPTRHPGSSELGRCRLTAASSRSTRRDLAIGNSAHGDWGVVQSNGVGSRQDRKEALSQSERVAARLSDRRCDTVSARHRSVASAVTSRLSSAG
jgi:hypothetical protein